MQTDPETILRRLVFSSEVHYGPPDDRKVRFDPVSLIGSDRDYGPYCPWCEASEWDNRLTHDADCPWQAAMELVGG